MMKPATSRTFSTVVFQTVLADGRHVSVRHGDITKEPCDCIVNAANGFLRHGGGVARAIADAAGPAMVAEGDAYIAAHGMLEAGQCTSTRAGGTLACSHVIHAVGPVWRGGQHGELGALRAALGNALLRAEALQCGSLAVPAISSGIFGLPVHLCASALVEAVLQSPARVPDVRLLNNDEPTVLAFEREMRERFGTSENTGDPKI